MWNILILLVFWEIPLKSEDMCFTKLITAPWCYLISICWRGLLPFFHFYHIVDLFADLFFYGCGDWMEICCWRGHFKISLLLSNPKLSFLGLRNTNELELFIWSNYYLKIIGFPSAIYNLHHCNPFRLLQRITSLSRNKQIIHLQTNT